MDSKDEGSLKVGVKYKKKQIINSHMTVIRSSSAEHIYESNKSHTLTTDAFSLACESHTFSMFFVNSFVKNIKSVS